MADTFDAFFRRTYLVNEFDLSATQLVNLHDTRTFRILTKNYKFCRTWNPSYFKRCKGYTLSNMFNNLRGLGAVHVVCVSISV